MLNNKKLYLILIAFILIATMVALPASAAQTGNIQVSTACRFGFPNAQVTITPLNGTQTFDTYGSDGKIQPDVAKSLKLVNSSWTLPQYPDGTVADNLFGNGQYLVALSIGNGMQPEYAVVTVKDAPAVARFQGQAVTSGE